MHPLRFAWPDSCARFWTQRSRSDTQSNCIIRVTSTSCRLTSTSAFTILGHGSSSKASMCPRAHDLRRPRARCILRTTAFCCPWHRACLTAHSHSSRRKYGSNSVLLCLAYTARSRFFSARTAIGSGVCSISDRRSKTGTRGRCIGPCSSRGRGHLVFGAIDCVLALCWRHRVVPRLQTASRL